MGIFGGPLAYVTDMINFPSAGRKVHNKRRNKNLEQLHEFPLANDGPSLSIRLRRRSVHSHFLW